VIEAPVTTEDDEAAAADPPSPEQANVPPSPEQANVPPTDPLPPPLADAPLQESTEPPPSTEPPQEPAPLPGEANGVAIAPSRSSHAWLWPLRVLLFVPRLAIEIIDAPIRGGLWLYEGYDLGPRTKQIFFNEDGTVGMYPLAFVESGFGLNAGLRFVHRDLFGKQEQLNLRASFGGRFEQLYAAKLSSEQRWPVVVVARLDVEVRPKDYYFGVGQRFDSPESRFSQLVSRALVSSEFLLRKNVRLEVGGAYTFRRFESGLVRDEAPSIAQAYPDDSLVGFEDGVSAVSALARVTIDTTHSPSRYESAATPSRGWLASGFASTARSVSSGPTRYIRVGADTQVYQRIFEGPRAIVLRANYEQVLGEREDIPFTDLPRLGGAVFGRGFQQDRFRDKASLLLSAEYEWSLSPMVLAALFVDYGRVAPKALDLASEFEDFALGGGLALQAHTAKSFLVRATLAGSKEGLFFNVSFDPQFGPTNILERK
tara:strand:+ start:57903 stop:59357 length:1455 start_codon:yes stop_codon:yes gene_type:complete